MNVPICPKHQTPMRASNNGVGFYCSKKDASSPSGYCTQKAGAATPAPQSFAVPPQTSQPAPQQTTPRHLLVIAALDFASRVYQGTAQDQGALALFSDTLRAADAELL